MKVQRSCTAARDLCDRTGAGGLSIGIHAGADEDCLGAERSDTSCRHGRVDPKTSGFVATGSDYPTAVWIAADNQGLTAELWPVALLYSRKEGIHIHMDDLAQFGSTL